jgi:uncharacterized phage-associated protein
MDKIIKIKAGVTTADAVANFFIAKAYGENKNITNKKLQKLLYYSQVWFMVNFNAKLFDNNIEAWIHGPVIVEIYHKYKEFGFSPITVKVEERSLDKSVEALLSDVWRIYGKLDANTLEDLSHSELPWQEARAKIDEVDFARPIMSIDSMYTYYAKKVEGKRK